MSRREMKKRMRASIQRKGQARSHSRENRKTKAHHGSLFGPEIIAL